MSINKSQIKYLLDNNVLVPANSLQSDGQQEAYLKNLIRVIIKMSQFDNRDIQHSEDIEQATNLIQVFQILDKSVKDLFNQDGDISYKESLKNQIQQNSKGQSLPEEIVIQQLLQTIAQAKIKTYLQQNNDRSMTDISPAYMDSQELSIQVQSILINIANQVTDIQKTLQENYVRYSEDDKLQNYNLIKQLQCQIANAFSKIVDSQAKSAILTRSIYLSFRPANDKELFKNEVEAIKELAHQYRQSVSTECIKHDGIENFKLLADSLVSSTSFLNSDGSRSTSHDKLEDQLASILSHVDNRIHLFNQKVVDIVNNVFLKQLIDNQKLDNIVTNFQNYLVASQRCNDELDKLMGQLEVDDKDGKAEMVGSTINSFVSSQIRIGDIDKIDFSGLSKLFKKGSIDEAENDIKSGTFYSQNRILVYHRLMMVHFRDDVDKKVIKKDDKNINGKDDVDDGIDSADDYQNPEPRKYYNKIKDIFNENVLIKLYNKNKEIEKMLKEIGSIQDTKQEEHKLLAKVVMKAFNSLFLVIDQIFMQSILVDDINESSETVSYDYKKLYFILDELLVTISNKEKEQAKEGLDLKVEIMKLANAFYGSASSMMTLVQMYYDQDTERYLKGFSDDLERYIQPSQVLKRLVGGYRMEFDYIKQNFESIDNPVQIENSILWKNILGSVSAGYDLVGNFRDKRELKNMLYYQNQFGQTMLFLEHEAVQNLFLNKCKYLDYLFTFYIEYLKINLVGKIQEHQNGKDGGKKDDDINDTVFVFDKDKAQLYESIINLEHGIIKDLMIVPKQDEKNGVVVKQLGLQLEANGYINLAELNDIQKAPTFKQIEIVVSKILGKVGDSLQDKQVYDQMDFYVCFSCGTRKLKVDQIEVEVISVQTDKDNKKSINSGVKDTQMSQNLFIRSEKDNLVWLRLFYDYEDDDIADRNDKDDRIMTILQEYYQIEEQQMKQIIKKTQESYSYVSDIQLSEHSDDETSVTMLSQFREKERMIEKNYMIQKFSEFGYSDCKSFIEKDMNEYYDFVYKESQVGQQIREEEQVTLDLFGQDIEYFIDRVFNNEGTSSYYYQPGLKASELNVDMKIRRRLKNKIRRRGSKDGKDNDADIKIDNNQQSVELYGRYFSMNNEISSITQLAFPSQIQIQYSSLVQTIDTCYAQEKKEANPKPNIKFSAKPFLIQDLDIPDTAKPSNQDLKRTFDRKILDSQHSIQSRQGDYDNSFVVYVPNLGTTYEGLIPYYLKDQKAQSINQLLDVYEHKGGKDKQFELQEFVTLREVKVSDQRLTIRQNDFQVDDYEVGSIISKNLIILASYVSVGAQQYDFLVRNRPANSNLAAFQGRMDSVIESGRDGTLKLKNNNNRIFFAHYDNDVNDLGISINVRYKNGDYVVVTNMDKDYDPNNAVDKKNIIFEFTSVPENMEQQIRSNKMNAIKYNDFFMEQILSIGYQPVLSVESDYIASNYFAMGNKECNGNNAWCIDKKDRIIPGLRLFTKKEIKMYSVENTIDILMNLEIEERRAINNNGKKPKRRLNKWKKKGTSLYVNSRMRSLKNKGRK